MADVAALVASYSRLGLFKHISTVCSEVIAKKGNDAVLALWSAFSSAMEGHVAAAIRQADALRSKRDVTLASLVCLGVFHERTGMVDRAALESVRSDLRKTEREATPRQLALAAVFAVHLKQWDQALALADAATTGASDDVVCLSARGWAELSSGGKEAAEAAIEYFDRAISGAEASSGSVGSGAVDARMGKAAALQCLERLDEAQSAVTDVIAVNKWMSPAVAERGRMQVQAGDWESVGEASATLLASDPTDVEGQMLAAVKALAGDGDTSAASIVMRQLIAALAKHEPGNADLILRYARPLSRLAGDSRPVLETALKMVRAAAEADPSRADALAESGFIQAQLGDLDGATESFTSAARLDDSCIDAIAGLIWCQLAQGSWDDASAQLEMFAVVQESVGRTAQMALLDAIVSWRQSGDPYAHMSLLNEARRIHSKAWQAAKEDPSVDAYTGLAVMDPTLQLRIAREMLIHARGADSFGAEAADSSASSSASAGGDLDAEVRLAASKGLAILKAVSAIAPGMAEARLDLARAHMRAGNADEASRALVDVLAADSSNAGAHLLMAQVALAQGPRFLSTAKASLDQTLAHNLRAHSSPVYQFVAARTAFAERRYTEAVRAAKLALKGPASGKSAAAAASAAASGAGKAKGVAEGALAIVSAGPLGELTDQDRVRLYVLLAEAHTAKDELTEATDVIDEATRAFAGTAEEVDVLVAHARLTLAKGSAEAAVRMLGNVPFGSAAFAKAQQVKADILLRHRRDRRAYIQCFQDVVDRRPASAAARVALSEAYMRISMPEEAVAALSEARAANPHDGALTRRLGRALVRMHDYDRAVEFYHEALRTLDSAAASGGDGGGSAAAEGSTSLDAGLVASLRQDLIELLVRQQRFAEAQALIDEELMRTERDAISLRGTRQSLRAMASVQRGIGDSASAVVTLEQALKVQQTVMSKLRREAPELLPAEQEAAADLCHEVAQAHLTARPPDESQAQRFLADALRAKESHVPSLRALARLLLRRGDVRNAERVVTSLRRADPKSVTAAMLAAELQMADGAVDAAAYQMSELLEANPTHYEALATSVRLLKLAGRLDDAAKMVTAAERAGRSASKEPGLRYCRGLIHKYQNQPAEAIACFNDARHSAVWGAKAVEQMVWLYVCPDGDAVWRTAKTTDDEDEDDEDGGMTGGFGTRGASSRGAAGAGPSGRPGATSLEESSEVAITLLRGIPRKHWGRQHDVLRAYALMIRPERAAKAEAQKVLAGIYGSDDKYVPAIAAMSTLHMLQDETTKAKNQLKHQARLPLDTDTTEDYVRCRLMLADVQMGAAKNDLAIKMCREALARDSASALAWEILGDIAEREMSYADAADHFARAWEADMERTARVGYKLAFNYLKSRRFTRAIDVCHKVLEQFPDYGKIQETIIDVARRSLRS